MQLEQGEQGAKCVPLPHACMAKQTEQVVSHLHTATLLTCGALQRHNAIDSGSHLLLLLLLRAQHRNHLGQQV